VIGIFIIVADSIHKATVVIVAKTGILIDSNIRYAIFELLELDRMLKI